MEIDDVELPESHVKFEEEDMVVDLMVICIMLPSIIFETKNVCLLCFHS